MSNRRLRECPTCHRSFDEHTLEAMGLRNGIVLNALCPGKNGPSDIDNVLHNKWVNPERFMFIEFKRSGGKMSGGQALLLKSLSGDWIEENTGRRIAIRFHVMNAHPENPEQELEPVVGWLWP